MSLETEGWVYWVIGFVGLGVLHGGIVFEIEQQVYLGLGMVLMVMVLYYGTWRFEKQRRERWRKENEKEAII